MSLLPLRTLQGSELPDRGSSEGPSLDSNALDLSSHASSGEEASQTYRNLAVNFVQIALPVVVVCHCVTVCVGTEMTKSSDSSLLPKAAAIFTTNVSIRTLAHMAADQLAAAAN